MSDSAISHLCEQDFLLSAAAADHDVAARAQFVRLARRALDWNYVLETAELHGVLPVLKSRVDRYCRDAAPAQFVANLSRACMANAARNLALTGELLRLLKMLEAEGIDAIPFKGPALAEQIYGNVAMRQFCDLDILVRPESVVRAKALLTARGYTPEFVLTPEREAEYIRSEHAFQLQRKEGNIVVELHWSLGSKNQAFPLTAADVWGRLDQGMLQGHPVRTLCPEDLVLYLSMHGAKHRWERLEWICCLANLIQNTPRLRWSGMFEVAAATGALRGLHLGLILAADVCSLPLPPNILELALADHEAADLAERVRAGLFLPEPVHRVREFQRHSFYIRSRERLLDRARIVWYSCARIPHPLAQDWTLFHLPSRMSFLYYFLRPLRLFRDYGLRILQG